MLSPPSVGFHYELSFFKSGSTSINTEDQGKVITFLYQLLIVVSYHNLPYRSRQDSNSYSFDFKVPLARFLMMYTENDTTTFHLLAPQKGIYLLDIFAANYPSMDMCTKKEATKYINVCRFKIDCPNIDMVSIIY